MLTALLPRTNGSVKLKETDIYKKKIIFKIKRIIIKKKKILFYYKKEIIINFKKKINK